MCRCFERGLSVFPPCRQELNCWHGAWLDTVVKVTCSWLIPAGASERRVGLPHEMQWPVLTASQVLYLLKLYLKFSTHKHCVLPTECLCVLYWSLYHCAALTAFHNRDGVCLLRGTDWISLGPWLDNSWTRFQVGPCGTGVGGQSDTGTVVCSNTLRHLLVWKVAGSIPNGVIGICHWHSPSSRTVAMGSTKSLT